MMRILLLDGGLDIHATEDEKYDFVIKVSEGKLDIQNIIDWIRTKSEKINGY
jgi:death-on-curing protein